VTITLAHEYLTVHEAATILRVSAPTIYRRCSDGRLAHVRVGGADGPIRVLASAVIPGNPARAPRTRTCSWQSRRGRTAGQKQR
jgi:excisionase family DNA binding protein